MFADPLYIPNRHLPVIAGCLSVLIFLGGAASPAVAEFNRPAIISECSATAYYGAVFIGRVVSHPSIYVFLSLRKGHRLIGCS